MSRRLLPLALLLGAALSACGGSGAGPTEEVVDFSGSWTMRVDFQYLPEDIVCSITEISLTVVQDGEILSGGSVGGAESCSQTGTTWPEDQIGTLTLSGNARANSAVFQLTGGDLSLSFSGIPRSGRFDGTFQGSAFLDPFDVGDVTITGTWSASR